MIKIKQISKIWIHNIVQKKKEQTKSEAKKNITLLLKEKQNIIIKH